MASKLGEAFVEIYGDSRKLDQELNQSRGRVNAWLTNIATGIAQGIGQAVFGTVANAIRTVTAEIPRSIQATSDLTEAINKTTVAFGDSAQEMLDWSRTSDRAFGQSQQGALEAASTFGLLFRTMGLTSDESAKMSRQLVELASDLASINNISPEEALEKLRAGLVGEIEPLRSVGVLLNATAVEAKAMELGLADSTKALTEQDKVLARYQLILEQTTLAQGDFARNSAEIANQQRILAAQIENARARFGQVFTPIYTVILRGINQIIAESSQHGEGILRALATGMVNGIIYLLPVIAQIRALFTYWLRPQSPPRILPDLDKWGAGAMQAYLEGFSKADFSTLQSLGGAIENVLRSFVAAGRLPQTDLVGRVFGSQAAIARAVAEWRRAGSLSQSAFEAIRRAAGPAGDSVANLVNAYFDLERASERAALAQERLSRVTEQYDRKLNPLYSKLDDLRRRQQAIRDRERLEEIGLILMDPNATTEERQLARLEAEEIRLRQRIESIERERDSAVEAERRQLEVAEREVAAKREAYEQAQATLDHQIKVNNLVAEEIALRERLAAEALAEQNRRLAEQEALLRELEAEQRKAEAAEAARLAEMERVYQAQLNYNLAIADTPGKIALLQLELQRYTKDSAEYYQILTQIHHLEQQLAKEREAAAGGAGAEGGGLIPSLELPSVDDLNIPTWAQELAEKLQGEFDKYFGRDSDNPLSLSDRLRESIAPESVELSPEVRRMVDALRDLATALQDVQGPLDAVREALIALGLASGETRQEAEANANATVETFRSSAITLEGIINLDWRRTLEGLRGIVGQVLLQIARQFPGTGGTEPEDATSPLRGIRTMGNAFYLALAFGFLAGQGPVVNAYIEFLQWIADQLPGGINVLPKDTRSPLVGLQDAGKALIGNIWEGAKEKWRELSEWWTERIQWLRDQLPFSEPKDPNSPLRGLEKSGESIIGQLQRGMERAALAITPTIAANVVAAGSSMVNHSYGPFHITVQTNGQVDESAGRAIMRGMESELMQMRIRGER